MPSAALSHAPIRAASLLGVRALPPIHRAALPAETNAHAAILDGHVVLGRGKLVLIRHRAICRHLGVVRTLRQEATGTTMVALAGKTAVRAAALACMAAVWAAALACMAAFWEEALACMAAVWEEALADTASVILSPTSLIIRFSMTFRSLLGGQALSIACA